MHRTTSIAILAVAAAIAANAVLGQDIVFPSDDDDSHAYVPNNAPVTERKPLSTPGECPENMLFYKSDDPKNSGVCDCKPRYVFFPQNETCHEVFVQGPCAAGHFVYLPVNESLPICAPNPCSSHDLVMYRGVCHRLRTVGGPCGDAVLIVNEVTFQLECASVDTSPQTIIEAPKRSCPKGSRRNRLGICKLVL